jgi:hypothetical protein
MNPSLLLRNRTIERVGTWFLAVIVFMVGFLFFFAAGTVPGGLSDSRFNMYVLEHGYRWLMHLDKSFWSAPFFYPAPNTIAYSDNHLGSLLFYSGFRILGSSRESAFGFWAITIFALNYLVTLVVLRIQKFHPLAAISSAYLFTFPLLMAGQMDHMQLAPRFMVPVAFWMAQLFIESGKGRFLGLLLAACAYQIYLGIYIGYFLILCLIPFCAFIFLYRKQWLVMRSFLAHATAGAVVRRSLIYGGFLVAFGLVLLPMAIPYYEVQQEIGRRAWEEVVPMLPRWQSYLFAPLSVVWGEMLRFGDSLPTPGEHELFVGLLPCLGMIVLAYLLWKRKLGVSESMFALAMMSVLIFSFVLTIYLLGFSLYRYAWQYLPGAGGIRGVSRIMLVLIYPMAFIFGLSVTHAINNWLDARAKWIRVLFGLGVLMLLVLDQAARVPSMSIVECVARIEKMKSEIGNSGRTVLWLNDTNGEHFVLRHLDAMLTGQDLGLNVVNGYSSLGPNGYPGALFTLTGDLCRAVALWARTHPWTITNKNLLQLGEICIIPENDYLPTPMKGFSGIDDSTIFHAWVTSQSAELGVPPVPDKQGWIIVSFDLATLNARSIKISGPEGQRQTVRLVPGQTQHVEMRVTATKPDSVIKLETDQDGVKSNGDLRTLFYGLENLRMQIVPAANSGKGMIEK